MITIIHYYFRKSLVINFFFQKDSKLSLLGQIFNVLKYYIIRINKKFNIKNASYDKNFSSFYVNKL